MPHDDSPHQASTPRMGPGSGTQGGQVIAKGTPEEVALISGSYTGQFLKSALEQA